MKRLSMNLPAIALVLALALSGAALTPIPVIPASANATASPKIATAATNIARQYIYYWYTVPGDQYNDWETLSYEEWEWDYIYWGDEIDTNPMGGTLIACGYMNPNYPHIAPPACYLYVHFVDFKSVPRVLYHSGAGK